VFQVPVLVCMALICFQPPGSSGGKVKCGKFKSCLLREQVKSSTLSGLCVHKRYEVDTERRVSVSAVARRIDLEKLASLGYEAAWKRRLLIPTFESYEEDSSQSLLWTTGYRWWKGLNNLETKEEKISFKQPDKERSCVSALAIERYSSSSKFSVFCSGVGLPPSHPSLRSVYTYNSSHLMDRLSLSPPENHLASW